MSKEEGNLAKNKSHFAVCDKYHSNSFSQNLSKCILNPETKRESDLCGVCFLQCERQGAETCHFFFELCRYKSNFTARGLGNIFVQTHDW